MGRPGGEMRETKRKEPTVDTASAKRYLRRMGKRPTSSSKPRAVGYGRVSTGKQADKGGSLAVQRDRIVEHAVLSGLDLVGVFEDAGISGAKGEDDRPGFRAALDAIRRGEASVLVATDADRLARDADEAGHARVEIRRAGGRVVVLSEVGEGIEVVAVRQLLAVLEREKVRARMRTWSAARLAKGLHMGPAPYGFRIGPDGTLEEHPDESPVLARIAALRASGATLRAVAEALDAEGVPARGGRGWNAMTVSKIERRGAK